MLPFGVEAYSEAAYLIGIENSETVLYRSTDGADFTRIYNFGTYRINNHGNSPGILVTRNGTIIVSMWNETNEYLFRSIDDGNTFKIVRANTDSCFGDWVETENSTLFLMSYGGLKRGLPRILRSNDWGATWDIYYNYPVATTHCEGLAYHKPTKTLYVSFGHNPQYTFGYCNVSENPYKSMVTLYTELEDEDWTPQRPINSLSVVRDYVIAGTEPGGAQQTVCELDGETYITTGESSTWNIAPKTSSYKGVGYVTTIEDANNASVYAVIPENGLWVELIRSENVDP